MISSYGVKINVTKEMFTSEESWNKYRAALGYAKWPSTKNEQRIKFFKILIKKLFRKLQGVFQ